jgi:hypothetical protein
MFRRGLSRRIVLGAITGILGAVAVSQGVLAAGPIIQPNYVPTVTVPAGAVCPFAFTVTPIVNRDTSKTWFDANGYPTRQIFTGHLVYQFSSGTASFVQNLSGPLFVSYYPNSSQPETMVFTGGQGGNPPTPDSNGAGRTVLQFDINGNLISATQVGTFSSICPALS